MENRLFEVQTLFPENLLIRLKNSTLLLVQNHFRPVQNFLSLTKTFWTGIKNQNSVVKGHF